MTEGASDRVLSAAELNRATLARQLLLERLELDPVQAVERLGALQAQEPASPYLALWTRLSGFQPEALDEAFRDRRIVKATLMRATLHAVSARDYASFQPAMAQSLRLFRERVMRDQGGGERLDNLAERALDYATEPRTNTEMRRFLEEIGGPAGERDWWWNLRIQVPFVMVPNGPPWSFGRQPRYSAARSWLKVPLGTAETGLDHLVRRYLGAFGPATLGDMFQWTRIERTRLTRTLERLGPELRTFWNEAGRLLYDLTDAPLPSADTQAPVRFLPMWDSVLLAYEDRSRVIPEAYRRRLIQTNGDFLPSFLVDGLVAGLWRPEIVAGRTRIRLEPFEPLSPVLEAELAEEVEGLAAFVEPREPMVYKRYVSTWMKRPSEVAGKALANVEATAAVRR